MTYIRIFSQSTFISTFIFASKLLLKRRLDSNWVLSKLFSIKGAKPNLNNVSATDFEGVCVALVKMATRYLHIKALKGGNVVQNIVNDGLYTGYGPCTLAFLPEDAEHISPADRALISAVKTVAELSRA